MDVPVYEVNTRTSKTVLCTSSEQLKNEMKKNSTYGSIKNLSERSTEVKLWKLQNTTEK